MNFPTNKLTKWLSSKETKTELRITSCELMHLREKGELEFKKVGNAYFYKLPKSSLE